MAIKGNTPWAVVLCRFSDRPEKPRDLAYFRDLFAVPGKAGLFDYWRDISYGAIGLEGTTVFDWIDMPFSQAEAAKKSRGERIQAAIAAMPRDINLSPFYGIVIVFNANIDSGSIGIQQLAGLKKNYGLMCTSIYDVTFNAHEMGHGYGLNHSFDTALTSWSPASDGTPGVYGDPYDIMSAKTFRNTNPMFQGPAFGDSGPGLNAPQLFYAMEWMPANRVHTVEEALHTPPYKETVTLAAVNHPEVSGPLMAQMYRFKPDPPSWTTVTVEFRTATGWDRGISQLNRGSGAVVIHESRPRGFYLLPSSDGPGWQLGQRYVDMEKNMSVQVMSIDNVQHTATVEIGLAYTSTAPIGGAGDVGMGWTWGNAFHPHPHKINFA
jgi:hypothetical protein